MQPTRWEQAGSRTCWRIWRRCPECEWHGDSVHEEREIDAFDEALDDGCKALRKLLDEFERRALLGMQGPFSEALHTDLITADDFRLIRKP